jgi:beta-galactosidase
MIVIGTENGHSREAWLSLRDHPFVSGQFLWTGIDYLGEAVWPMVANPSGLIDKTGKEKPRGYERESWWSDKPMVYIVRHEANGGQGPMVSDWTPVEMEAYDEADVSVYSNCDEVELFLNGKSLGSKEKPADDAARSWKFTFEKGSLKAVGKNKSAVVAEQELKTAGAPAKIILKADQTKLADDWNDVAFVTATVTDANGITIPNAENEIRFTLEGPGVIAAVDNGNNASHESYQGNKRKAWKGTCIALIKDNEAKGKITIKASADGLAAGSVSLDAAPLNTGSYIIVND